MSTKKIAVGVDKNVEEKDIIVKSLKLLETGIEMKKWKFNREEIYADRFERRGQAKNC